ncbi:MAG: substrate-binding domain-containing protein [Alphaproteobacteria bacterium]
MLLIKKIIALTVALVAITASLISSANEASKTDKPIRIGVLVYGLSSQFMQVWTKQARNHPAVLSGRVELIVLDGQYDAFIQNNQLKSLTTRNFDAAIFVPIDIEAGALGIKAAYDASIPVIGSDTRVNSDLLTSYIGSDDVQSGYMEAKFITEKIGCKGNVVILEGPLEQSASIERKEGNLKALAECPDVNILEMSNANWSRDDARLLMEEWLEKHPGRISGIIGQNDEMALGAIDAIKLAGLEVGDFAIAGIDGIADALYAVKKGEMVTIAQDAEAQAQGAIDLALRQVLGSDYQPQARIWYEYNHTPWNNGTDKNYDVPWTPVTPEKIDTLFHLH